MTKPRRRKTSRPRRKAPAVEYPLQFTVKVEPDPQPVSAAELWRQFEPRVIRYPSDWWQAFKDRWFPAWLAARYPVQFTERHYREPRIGEALRVGDLVAVTPQGTVTTAANTETSQGGIVFGTALAVHPTGSGGPF